LYFFFGRPQKDWIMKVLAIAIVLLAAIPQLHAQSLESSLVKEARKIVAHAREQGYQNVGVLKFQATKDGKTLSDKVGALNLFLARQLEAALIMTNDPRSPIGVVRNASAVAARTPGANHLSREGRMKLFTPRYPLAWGDEKVNVDFFVTGLAAVSPDLKTISVSLLSFDSKANKLTPIGKDIVAPLRPGHLVDVGESFLVRGIFDGGKVELDKPVPPEEMVKAAVHTRQEKEKHPIQEEVAPIKLTVYYDDREIKPQYRDGKAYLEEPKEGQEVSLGLKCVAKVGRFGVVLKVNGESTQWRERLPDFYCNPWVLEAGEGPYRLHGYAISDDKSVAFRVASAAESKALEMDYGADVGTITMTVFRELVPRKKTGMDLKDLDAPLVKVVEKAADVEEAADLSVLKANLLKDANRGVITAGKGFASKIERVRFTPDPDPVMAVTLIYYKKR
jgi:hypothetical protein